MKTSRRSRNAPQIPLSAMSDIALLLLIFFIVTTQFIIQRALGPQLPSVTPQKEKASENMTTVVVEEDSVFLDEERIKLEDLAPFLAQKLADKIRPEDRAVIVDGRETVRWERVAFAVNEIKRAGGIPTMGMDVEE
jgi:biopolymer transport protein ExbD